MALDYGTSVPWVREVASRLQGMRCAASPAVMRLLSCGTDRDWAGRKGRGKNKENPRGFSSLVPLLGTLFHCQTRKRGLPLALCLLVPSGHLRALGCLSVRQDRRAIEKLISGLLPQPPFSSLLSKSSRSAPCVIPVISSCIQEERWADSLCLLQLIQNRNASLFQNTSSCHSSASNSRHSVHHA